MREEGGVGKIECVCVHVCTRMGVSVLCSSRLLTKERATRGYMVDLL